MKFNLYLGENSRSEPIYSVALRDKRGQAPSYKAKLLIND